MCARETVNDKTKREHECSAFYKLLPVVYRPRLISEG